MKHEFLRKNWNKYSKNNDYISKALKDYLGTDYFKKCYEAIDFCLKNLVR